MAVTYDLINENHSANISLANNSVYTVEVEKFNKLGLEIGANVSTFAYDKIDLSVGYLARMRKDYQNHTILFDAKYNF